jgi:hypothetical protein
MPTRLPRAGISNSRAAILIGLCGSAAVFGAQPVPARATGDLKWHPGHYAFVQSSPLREAHIYENFRGIQKTYTWRALEPEKDRYDFRGVGANPIDPQKSPSGRRTRRWPTPLRRVSH